MNVLLERATEWAVPTIELIALVVILGGTVEAFMRAVVRAASSRRDAAERDTWLRYARWLVAGLTFQLAADIVETSVAPTWEQIGRIGAIAVIRTFLNYFLERDIAEIRERHREPEMA